MRCPRDGSSQETKESSRARNRLRMISRLVFLRCFREVKLSVFHTRDTVHNLSIVVVLVVDGEVVLQHDVTCRVVCKVGHITVCYVMYLVVT